MPLQHHSIHFSRVERTQMTTKIRNIIDEPVHGIVGLIGSGMVAPRAVNDVPPLLGGKNSVKIR